ncbi:MAG: pyrimidine dimer DNA glycosylase [Elusimicrobia bacterium GWC2_51_8]|nr:MAG: pyrimidine dimer DNA glycosylase [Elusimicrobia bacterium GWA2_51_34]OGR58030.1 MAG: pyrimidine dimer DNA glycosylase [Elusimicrobia bacterium GWC2_51_8]
MRIWDVNPKYLCRQHLLAEHRELHGLWNILTKHKCRGGYSRHPETLRWVGRQNALYKRHEALVEEFRRRGYKHRSPLNRRFAMGSGTQRVFLDTIKKQKIILKNKPCDCPLPGDHK